MEKIGFIGGGQMAEALIKGILASGIAGTENIAVSEPLEGRRIYLRDTYGVYVSSENREILVRTRIIILAVKPQVMARVLEEIAPEVTADHLIISIAAGIPLSFLEGKLPEGTRVVRVMPNTPALVLEAMSVLSPGKAATEEDLDAAMNIFSAIGEALSLPEAYLDAVTGLSGSGPAYVFAFIEGLIDAGVRVGLPRPQAERLAIQTVLGAARLAKETSKDPYQLKAMVTSPGGTTIAGLKEMERAGFKGIIFEAVEAATRRSQELAEEVK
ncbi:pyrroline-5-carboxylate reductase [Thermosulfuriphilus sp.]